jgi:hypothetical protein
MPSSQNNKPRPKPISTSMRLRRRVNRASDIKVPDLGRRWGRPAAMRATVSGGRWFVLAKKAARTGRVRRFRRYCRQYLSQHDWTRRNVARRCIRHGNLEHRNAGITYFLVIPEHIARWRLDALAGCPLVRGGFTHELHNKIEEQSMKNAPFWISCAGLSLGAGGPSHYGAQCGRSEQAGRDDGAEARPRVFDAVARW